MLRKRPSIVRCCVDQLAFLGFRIHAANRTNATIQQNLPTSKMSAAMKLRTQYVLQSQQLGSMLNVVEAAG